MTGVPPPGRRDDSVHALDGRVLDATESLRLRRCKCAPHESRSAGGAAAEGPQCTAWLDAAHSTGGSHGLVAPEQNADEGSALSCSAMPRCSYAPAERDSARVGLATNGSWPNGRRPRPRRVRQQSSGATDSLGAPGAGSIAVAFATLLSCAPVVLNGLDVPMVFAFVCSVKVVASPT